MILIALLSGCGGSSSRTETDTDTDTTTNTAPQANAGSDQTVTTGNTISLSGSQSSDADGDTLTYTWTLSTLPSGSSASLSATATLATSFVADIDGTYTASLIVNDGTVDSSVDTISIVASTTSSTTSYSLTQGLATTTIANLFSQGSRVAGIGSITDADNTSWTVPAEVRFQDETMPTASDLYNDYGNTYSDAATAVAALDGSDIIEIDAGGEVITAYVFADNYFEMYINGTAVGKDPVPFTEFNSNIVRFRVSQPFTIAMLLVDWEENLGTGTEDNQGSTSHPGDGGLVAVFKDASDTIIAVTDSSWKAQTYYTAPIVDLSCVTESGTTRSSANCSTDAAGDFANIYGLHWARPSNWTSESFDDSAWPSATTYTNDTVGVDNKTSYTNFTDIFDDSTNDADFIWSTNLVLDNEVLIRTTVGESNSSSLTLSSDAVKDNMILPLSATCEGTDNGSSPTITWSDAPTDAQSFAITMHHYPNANDAGDLSLAHSYWTMFDIPAATTTLTTGQSDTGTFGTNTVNSLAEYSAPCSGDVTAKEYTITLYALSNAVGSLGLVGNSTDIVALTAAIADTTLETATLTVNRARYNSNSDDHVPTSVPSDCETKSVAFAAYDNVSVSCDSTTMTVTTSTFLPYRSALDLDKPDVGIQSWIGRVPIPEEASWTLPLQPVYLSTTESNLNIHDAIGISVEGIPILHYAKEEFNGETGTLGVDYSDRDTIILGEIDQCGAHAGNGEDYHYHMAPLCMMDSHDPSQPLAYMFDGIPLYFGTAGGVSSANSSGTNYGGGRYTDLDYRPSDVKSGVNPLDECNAYDLHGDGSEYVYYTSTEAPYTIACYRGEADQESSVPTSDQWTVDRDLSWMGNALELTDHDTMTFDSNTWTFIEITPSTGNNQITGDTALLMYRQLTAQDSDFSTTLNCFGFRYRLDSSDTTGSNDTVVTHCR